MTLTEASFWTKRFGVIAAVGGVIITIILFIILTKKPPRPEEYLNPNYGCTEKGAEFLEKAKFPVPKLDIDSESIAEFEVATKSGKINTLPSVINVYKFNNRTQDFDSLFKASTLAGQLGFDKDKVILSEDSTVYTWKDSLNKRTLVIDAKNQNFVLDTDPAQVKKIAGESSVPDEGSAKSTALNVLSSNSLIDTQDEYLSNNIKVTYLNIQPDGSFRLAGSKSEADLVRVDFFRERSIITLSSKITGVEGMVKDFQNVTGEEPTKTKKTINDKVIEYYTFNTGIVLPRTNFSNISVFIGPENKEGKLKGGLNSTYRIEYTYWPVSLDACGTYPLIPTSTAKNEIEKRNGILAYLYEKGGDFVSGYNQRNVKTFRIIYDVKIVYYETPEESNFLLPVYLFSGEAVFDDGSTGQFDIYYPAIDYNNIKDKVVIKNDPAEEEKESFL